ncbi:protein aspartic protease in guard cell 1 [Phtheirospermum japonicum]|uniref:Protein aspartic protease in guard cell 1 n=1 Tax=Phtheirospermum japonicum TaxID=374723 RepID=A0A830DG49_9LAMI|nr:protein aspartic protease in guard cell 1 [Phtheirospermum japonicum]
MALDTGSDVVWLQCTPCVSCYTQSGPIFNPTSSSSFRPVPCGSNLCQQLIDPGCDAQERCTYYVPYDDGSFTNGDLSTETFTFVGTTVSNVSLGCGHDNEGLFNGSAGGIFSYCLVDRNSSSKSSILFGESAVPPNAVFTPLLRDTLYYVTLTGISVGGHLVPGVNSSVFESQGADGGVIIDSGTTITRLAEPAYDALRDAFQAEVTGLNHTSGVLTFDTCYEPPGAGANVTVPTVTLHFDGGADMRLPAENYLVRADADGKLCLAFASTTSGLSIIGNFQQQGFRVVYDLAANRVGFAPDSC